MEIKDKDERKKLAARIKLFKKERKPKEIGKLNFQLHIVSHKGSLIRYLNNAFEITKTRAILQNTWSIRHMNNPSEENQILAMKIDVMTIGKIKNLTDKAKFFAIRKDAFVAMKAIKKPTKEMQILAVSIDYHAVGFIKNPCKEVQLSSLEKDIHALDHNHKLCLEARKFIKDHVCKHVTNPY